MNGKKLLSLTTALSKHKALSTLDRHEASPCTNFQLFHCDAMKLRRASHRPVEQMLRGAWYCSASIRGASSARMLLHRPPFLTGCGDYMLVGRCWTSCNLFPIRNLAVSQHAPSIAQFFIFFQSFPTICYFVYHLLLRPGTGRFFRNRRCDFQQSNVAMLEFCFFFAFI